MKKKFTFIFVLLFYSCLVQSQVFFNNRYIIDQTAIIFQRIIQTEDTIITMGLGSTFYHPFPAKVMFTKFDQEGEVLSYDLILGDSLTRYFPLSSSTLERKVIVVGGSGLSQTNESGFYALYVLDTGLEWINQYYPPNGWTIFFNSCLFLEDKILILAGQQNHNFQSKVSSKLICTDLQGDILWEKDFGNSNIGFDFFPGGITSIQDSGIYIGLHRSDFPANAITNSHSIILELDLEGNIITQWMNDEINTDKPEQIIELSDSSLLFVGRHYYGYHNNTPLSQGYICKVDSLNNRDWSLKTGTPTLPTDMNNIIATMDGNYIAVGVTLDSLSSSQVLTESGHIIKFNIEGEIIWEKRYFGIDADAEYNRLYDIVELPDSSLLLCGESVDLWADFPVRGWLLKLDKNGNLDSTVSIGAPNVIVFENDNLHVFPNPSSEQMAIELKNKMKIELVEIFDVSGIFVESSKYDNVPDFSVHFNISHLNSGVYIVRVNGKYLKKISVF